MAQLSHSLNIYSDGSVQEAQPVVTEKPLFMHKEDSDTDVWDWGVRTCAPCPAVWVLNEPNTKFKLTKDWQFYLRAINYNMTVAHVSALLDYKRAFTNGTGFGDPTDLRANYLLGTNLDKPLPQFDKDRCCSRTVMTGAKTLDGKGLVVERFNGNKPPPLKPGKTYPQTIEQVNINDYLYNPRGHRYMFVVANIVNARGELVPFPNGGLYDWTGDNMPYVFLPLVSDEIFIYPLDMLVEVSTVPSPYRKL